MVNFLAPIHTYFPYVLPRLIFYQKPPNCVMVMWYRKRNPFLLRYGLFTFEASKGWWRVRKGGELDHEPVL